MAMLSISVIHVQMCIYQFKLNKCILPQTQHNIVICIGRDANDRDQWLQIFMATPVKQIKLVTTEG